MNSHHFIIPDDFDGSILAGFCRFTIADGQR